VIEVWNNGSSTLAASFTPDLNWHFLMATYPSGQTAVSYTSIYLDGVLLTNCAATGTWNTGSYEVDIGKLTNISGYYFPGLLNDMRIDSSALQLNDAKAMTILGPRP